MCLAIPMQIQTVSGHTATARAKGIEREICLFLLQDRPPVPGDFVLVHVGYAIQRVSTADALEAWHLHDQMQPLNEE